MDLRATQKILLIVPILLQMLKVTIMLAALLGVPMVIYPIRMQQEMSLAILNILLRVTTTWEVWLAISIVAL